MNESAIVFILLGGAFLLGLAADAIGRRTHLPRVTMVLVLGFLVGPAVLDLLPEGYEGLFQRASEIALTMVGFLLGESLVHSIRDGDGRVVLLISITAVVATAAIVFAGLWAIGVPITAALLLAGIATATDPAATVDVIRQTGAKGRFPDVLKGVVAIDDAWGLLGFSLLMSVAQVTSGNGDGFWGPLREGLWEIGGAIVIGTVLGLIMAAVAGRISKDEPTLLEAMGFTFLACGLAIGASVSFILTAMIMGAFVALFARRCHRPFHAIENIEVPFMILFFTLAGASLDLVALKVIGWTGALFLILRTIGRLLGGWWGSWWAGAPKTIRRGMGMSMMPQAGVALGMALLAQQKFPESGELILQIAIGSTVFFEVLGPFATRWALTRADRYEGVTGSIRM